MKSTVTGPAARSRKTAISLSVISPSIRSWTTNRRRRPDEGSGHRCRPVDSQVVENGRCDVGQGHEPVAACASAVREARLDAGSREHEHRELLATRVAGGDGGEQDEQVTLGVERARDVAHQLVGRAEGPQPSLATGIGGHPLGARIEPGQVARLDQHQVAVAEGIDGGRSRLRRIEAHTERALGVMLEQVGAHGPAGHATGAVHHGESGLAVVLLGQVGVGHHRRTQALVGQRLAERPGLGTVVHTVSCFGDLVDADVYHRCAFGPWAVRRWNASPAVPHPS